MTKREGERERACVWERERELGCECEKERVSVWEREKNECVCERERDKERVWQIERECDREREWVRERERERVCVCERERVWQRERKRVTERESVFVREREKERERVTERERERDKVLPTVQCVWLQTALHFNWVESRQDVISQVRVQTDGPYEVEGWDRVRLMGSPVFGFGLGSSSLPRDMP